MDYKKLNTLIAVTGFAAATIHIINKTTCYLSTIANLTDNSDGNYYEWRFGRIYYKKTGEGTPILLIHDLNSHSSCIEWKKVIGSLSENHTVYSIDLLGCGHSEKPNLTYTNYLYVQLITDFIKNVIREKTDIIATGDSSSFALMTCNIETDIINRIIMVNPTSINTLAKVPSKRTKTLKLLLQVPLIGTLLYNILQTESNISESFRSKYYYNSLKVEDRLIKTYMEAAHLDNSASKYLFASIKGRYTNANILHCIEKINNSIFIISGGQLEDSSEVADQYIKYAPAIESIIIDNAKFLPQLEVPEEFVEQINILLYENEL